MPKKFDLRSIQSDSLDLPSVASYLDWRPSLREFQKESEELPSLKTFQSLDEDEFPSLKSMNFDESTEDDSKITKEGKKDTENLRSKKCLISSKISCSESRLDAINMFNTDDIQVIETGNRSFKQTEDVINNSGENAEQSVQNLMFNNFVDFGPQRKLKSKLALQERFQHFK